VSTRLQRFAFRWLAREETVRVADCVHFAAFRFGRGELNPYENYTVALSRRTQVADVRARFEEFLRGYRPVNMGEALGVRLSGEHGLWQFPWARRPFAATGTRPGWHDNPADVPDILTHFSARGILRSRIEQEFRWLEAALHSIREHGYQPQCYSGHPQARRLVAADGSARYLMHDGNHRLSALAAMGHTEVVVCFVPRMDVHEADLPCWWRVADGSYEPDDARRVFRAYFDGNPAPHTTGEPAVLLES